MQRRYIIIYYKKNSENSKNRGLLAQEISCIAFCLCIYNKRNNEKIIAKYFFYNIDRPFSKFYLNQTSITIKKEKNLIQEEASKYSGGSKFRINVFQL